MTNENWPDAEDEPDDPMADPALAAKLRGPVSTGWWHDAGHSATAEREAAQRERDEAAGYGKPPEEDS